ncbi:MAG: nuclear transport factor 2 family protein [Chitinophagaceae bacterium]
MKKLSYLLVLCFVVNAAAYAQSAVEKSVDVAVQLLKKAMLDGNRADLENITSRDLTYGHSNGKMEDKAAFVEALASGKSDFLEITLAEQTIKIAGNTAIVRHHLTGENMDGGKPGKVNLGVLLVWQKEKGKWKLLARQAFKIV